MPNWAIHLIVPLLALLIVSRKEDWKYILLLLPVAVIPDMDSIVTQHRMILHNIFIPVILLLLGWRLQKYRTVFVISAVYFASHVFLDMFGGGVVLFYPFYDRMSFVNASLVLEQPVKLIWTFEYGFTEYDSGWKNAHGYITDSPGTGALGFVILAGICLLYRNRQKREG
jgi:membrane-bound metal-dependent hydrolase YbcI (DUF457 family)